MSPPRVAAVIQARTGSTRLPGKVLADLCGRPMIAHVVERAGRIEGVDRVVVATTDSPEDDPLARLVEDLGGVGLFRGPTDDVLGRYAGAAAAERAEVVVRLTADCPLLCPSVSSRVLALFGAADPPCDYASNTLERTWPRGLDTEVFTAAALRRADAEARAPAEREHVTPYLWRRPESFRLLAVTDRSDRSDHRWTVDTAEDLELVSRIYRELHPRRPAFDYADILACLEAHPEWSEINRAVRQREVPR